MIEQPAILHFGIFPHKTVTQKAFVTIDNTGLDTYTQTIHNGDEKELITIFR